LDKLSGPAHTPGSYQPTPPQPLSTTLHTNPPPPIVTSSNGSSAAPPPHNTTSTSNPCAGSSSMQMDGDNVRESCGTNTSRGGEGGEGGGRGSGRVFSCFLRFSKKQGVSTTHMCAGKCLLVHTQAHTHTHAHTHSHTHAYTHTRTHTGGLTGGKRNAPSPSPFLPEWPPNASSYGSHGLGVLAGMSPGRCV
jgi:hypothetical protein